MAVIRQKNWLGQQRCDVVHLREIESGVAGDFDVLAGSIMAGRYPLVVTGFTLVTSNIFQAEDLQIKVAGAALIHFHASTSGSIFQVPSDRANEILASTNARVSGGFTPSQVNYIGVDLRRSADITTVDEVMFLDANTSTEDPKEVPLAITEEYNIIISTTDFSLTPGLAPIAKVTTGPTNDIVLVEDARSMMFRLGSGGTSPDAGNYYPWPAGRKEGSTGDVFVGGDKVIGSQKSWMDATMTRLWETGGGEFWYSPTADRNVKMIRTGAAFGSNGEYFEWDGTNLHWKGLVFIFDNSTAVYNEVENQLVDFAGLTDLADGECIYVDVDRSVNRTIGGGTALLAVKTTLALMGQGVPPGSRWAIAWRYGAAVYTRDQSYAVNSSQLVATSSSTGDVQLSANSDTPTAPVVPVLYIGQVLGSALTRGPLANNYLFGSGNLTVGGSDRDQNVLIKTTRSQDSAIFTGFQDFGTTGNATVEIENHGPLDVSPDNLTQRLRGFNAGDARLETAQWFEVNGAIGMRNVSATPATPAPTVTDPIRTKYFITDNGQPAGQSPLIRRDQFCIMWWDGSITVVADSPAY